MKKERRRNKRGLQNKKASRKSPIICKKDTPENKGLSQQIGLFIKDELRKQGIQKEEKRPEV